MSQTTITGDLRAMTRSTQRVLKRRGRVALIETANPVLGIGYSLRIGRLGLWNGESLEEAEKEFEKATAALRA